MSKRWRELCKLSWRSVKTLDFSHYTWGSLSDRDGREISNYNIQEVLKRCGPYLKEINLSLVPYHLSPHAVTIIGHFCPNLKIINITGITVTTCDIQSLTDHCHQITKFSIGPTNYVCDVDLQNLFSVNPKLRYFRVFNSIMSSQCLMFLPFESIEEIVLELLFPDEEFLLQVKF